MSVTLSAEVHAVASPMAAAHASPLIADSSSSLLILPLFLRPPPCWYCARVCRVTWTNTACDQGAAIGVRPDACPHPTRWLYTVNDAWMGRLCANNSAAVSGDRAGLRAVLRKYLNQVRGTSSAPCLVQRDWCRAGGGAASRERLPPPLKGGGPPAPAPQPTPPAKAVLHCRVHQAS